MVVGGAASGKRSVSASSAAAQKPLTVNEFAWAKKFQEQQAARQGYELPLSEFLDTYAGYDGFVSKIRELGVTVTLRRW